MTPRDPRAGAVTQVTPRDHSTGECEEVSRRELWIAVLALWSIVIAFLLLVGFESDRNAEEPRIVPLTDRA